MRTCSIDVKPGAAEIWLKRSDNENSKKKARDTFTAGAVKQCFKQVDQATGERINKLYEQTIDYGAHPNPGGLLVLMEQIEHSNKTEWRFPYTGGGSEFQKLAVKTCARVGLGALLVLKHVYLNVFKDPGVFKELELLWPVDALQGSPKSNSLEERGVDPLKGVTRTWALS